MNESSIKDNNQTSTKTRQMIPIKSLTSIIPLNPPTTFKYSKYKHIESIIAKI